MTTFAQLARKIRKKEIIHLESTIKTLFSQKAQEWEVFATEDKNCIPESKKWSYMEKSEREIKKSVTALRECIHDFNNPEAQFNSKFEKKRISSILAEHKISSTGFNFNVYRRLLPIVRFIDHHEKTADSEPTHLIAAKLSILFGSVKEALAYIRRYEKKYPKCKDLMGEACKFALPENPKWNIKLWRSLAQKHMPNPRFRRILPHLHKIEAYVQDPKNKTLIDKVVVDHFEKKIEAEYNKKHLNPKKDQAVDLEQHISEKLSKATIQKKIEEKANKEFSEYQSKAKQTTKNTAAENTAKTKDEVQSVRDLSYFTKKITDEVRAGLTKQFQQKQLDIPNFNPDIARLTYLIRELETHKSNIQEYSRLLFKRNYKLSSRTPLTVLTQLARAVAFDRQLENLNAANQFFDNDLNEADFNLYLSLKPTNSDAFIPKVFIDGAKIDQTYQSFYITKLDPTDPRAAYLGHLTSNCQSLGKNGAEPTIHGITNTRSGFYVLCQKKGKEPAETDAIMAECWAWRTKEGHMVLDSIESQMNFRKKNEALISHFFIALAQRLITEKMDPPIQRVLVGSGGETPKALKLFTAIAPSIPIDHQGYMDSQDQCILADRKLPVLKYLLAHVNLSNANASANASASASASASADVSANKSQSKENNEKENLEKESIENLMLFCDLCLHNNRLDFLEAFRKDLTTSQQLDARIKQSQQFVEALKDYRGRTGYASGSQQAALDLQRLIKAGANLDFTQMFYNERLTDLLIIAVREGHFELVVQLVNHKANVNARLGLAANRFNIQFNENSDDTILQLAIQIGHFKIALFLIENGADVSAKGDNLRTALYYAAAYSSDKAYQAIPNVFTIIDALIKKGAAPNALDSYQPPIFIAIRRHNTETVRYLLACGANATFRPSWNGVPQNTPLEEARACGFEDIVTLLEEHIKLNASKAAPITVAAQPLHFQYSASNSASNTAVISGNANENGNGNENNGTAVKLSAI